MRHMGMQGYMTCARDVLQAFQCFSKAVADIPELKLCGSPVSPVVAFMSAKRGFDIYQVCTFAPIPQSLNSESLSHTSSPMPSTLRSILHLTDTHIRRGGAIW
jgi:glutamate/tyrosine decarboxylase-like PLP-dependent enzyme